MTRGRKKRQKSKLEFLRESVALFRKNPREFSQAVLLRVRDLLLRGIKIFRKKLKENIRKKRRSFYRFLLRAKSCLVRFHILHPPEDIEDVLNRTPYAKRIANEIIAQHKDEKNTTLAISAQWGSGKTYILKLLKPFLKKRRI